LEWWGKVRSDCVAPVGVPHDAVRPETATGDFSLASYSNFSLDWQVVRDLLFSLLEHEAATIEVAGFVWTDFRP
jgi:hypothetical protein